MQRSHIKRKMIESSSTEASAERARTGVACAISGRSVKPAAAIRLSNLRPNLGDRIRRDHPDLAAEAMISKVEVDHYRSIYVEELLRDERGELTEVERQVAQSLADEHLVAENIEKQFDAEKTFGERVSDNLSGFGGSWTFILSFTAVLAAWVIFNAAESAHAFDPYPFIFLNLVLSCIAAFQAPIIMMSQRRSEMHDRVRSQSDYRINLKAELEIRHLHEKLDHLISHQWQRLAEIQQLQLDTMQQDRHGSSTPRRRHD
jgi:uncharacterized membrane protein